MSVALVVLLVAVAGAALTAAWSISRLTVSDPIDPVAEERWLVRHARRFPRAMAYLRRRTDRTTAGGLLLTVSFAVVFATAFVVGLVFDLADSNATVAEIDESVSKWGSENASSEAVDVLKPVTDLGGTEVLLVVLVAVGLFDFVRRRRRDVLLFLLVVGAGQLLLSNALKLVIERERPSVLQLAGAAGSSFPSGHSTAAAACWAAVALVLTRHAGRRTRAFAGALAAFVAVAVGASRALLGVHWVTDVVAGLALGWGWFTVVAIAFGGRMQRLGDPVVQASAREPSHDSTKPAVNSGCSRCTV
jgi:membrane-associated phospholipid phosphatase